MNDIALTGLGSRWQRHATHNGVSFARGTTMWTYDLIYA